MAAETIVSRDVQQYNETIPLDRIAVSGNNPRAKVEDEGFEGLKQDLAANGLINPILVRPVGNPDCSRYEIVCGHRRLEAARQLGWASIRCTVRAMTDEEAFDLMGVENIQRHNLTPIEELRWLSVAAKNAEAKGEKQKDFAARIGKGPSWVSNKLRILDAPRDVLDLYADGKLGDKHVLVLLAYRQYPDLLAELMAFLNTSIRNDGAVSASLIEYQANLNIRMGTCALCLDPFPRGVPDLRLLFFQDGTCKGRDCDRVKMIEVDGNPRPYCLDKECWTKRIRAAEDKLEQENAKVYGAEQDAARSADEEKEIEAANAALERGHECIYDSCSNFAGRGNQFCPEHDTPEKREAARGREGNVQKCHVLSCGNNTLPGKFWCEEHMTPESRREDREEDTDSDVDPEFVKARGTGRCLECGEWDERTGCSFDCISQEECDECFTKEDLPVKAEGPAPAKVYRCKICGAELPLTDKVQQARDMIQHLLDNKGKERHHRALQKFLAGLFDNDAIMVLMRYFEMPKEEAPETRTPAGMPGLTLSEGESYWECGPKDRGAIAKSKDQAREVLQCDKCKIKKCQGPQEAN